jgi:ABC-type nitrate/sulfonate/bicarbonate transport system substrate-binding protein
MIKLNYGLPTDKEGIQLRLGVDRGFFRDEGLDLQLEVVFGGPEIASRYDSGALKVGELGTPPAITAIGKGARFKLIASGVRRRAVQYLVAAPQIADWPDLRGKTAAALSIGSCSYWFMRLVLQSHGLEPDKDVNVVGLGPRYPKVLELFEAGELQAAVISEPNVTIGESRGLFRVLQSLTDQAYCPTMQWSVVAANRQVIDEEPELLRAVLRASRRSLVYCEAHPDELAAYAASYYGIDSGIMRRSLARESPDLHSLCQIDLAGLGQAIDLQHRLGAIKAPMPVEDLVDLRFMPAEAESV